MGMQVKDAGGVLQEISSLTIKDGAALRQILQLKVMDGAELRTVATFVEPLSLGVTPAALYESGFASNVIESDDLVATPTGGLGPFTYAWSVVSGTATITTPASAITSVGSGILTVDVPEDVTVRCTCTDSAGSIAMADADITFLFYNPGL